MDTHEGQAYAVPTYQAPPNASWYHFLHGNVPGHQIDFIFRPDVPQGSLTRQHFGHLARLMKYIEPRAGAPYAFAIGNLSRDDTQYEPGHGGITLIFGLRVHGAVDHAGRQDPPFCHAIVGVDRHFDAAVLVDAAMRFHEQLVADGPGRIDGRRWYQSYVLHGQQAPWSVLADIHAYVRAFEALPGLLPSDLGLRWTMNEAPAPKRVVIVHPDEMPFATLAEHMARVTSVLVESDIRWTAISTGREQDLLGGTTIRFVSEREAVQEPDDVVLMPIDQVPIEPREIAMQLFGAHEVRLSQTNRLKLRWRRMGEAAFVGAPDSGRDRPWAKPAEEPEKTLDLDLTAESAAGLSRPHTEGETKRKRASVLPMVIAVAMLIAVLVVGVGLMASGAVGRDEPAPKRPAAPAVSVSVEAAKRTEMVPPEKPIQSVEAVQSAEPAVAASASASAPKNTVSKGKTKGGGKRKSVVIGADYGGRAH